jgi:hypothetical protein
MAAEVPEAAAEVTTGKAVEAAEAMAGAAAEVVNYKIYQ